MTGGRRRFIYALCMIATTIFLYRTVQFAALLQHEKSIADAERRLVQNGGAVSLNVDGTRSVQLGGFHWEYANPTVSPGPAKGPVTDEQLQVLRTLPDLRWLSLAETGITDKDVFKYLDGIPLYGICVRNTLVTDTAAEFLLRNSNLRVADFSGTAITDKSVEYVKKHGGIREIWVDKTKMSIMGKSELKNIKGLQVHE